VSVRPEVLQADSLSFRRYCMKKEFKFTLWYYVLFLFAISVLQLLWFPGTGSRQEISYKEFRDNLRKGQISRVVILPEQIVGLFKSAPQADRTPGPQSPQSIGNSPTAPWRMRISQIEEELHRQFVVTRIPGIRDSHLLEELDAAGVDYSGRIESNFFRNLFLNWLFPFLLIFVIWSFVFRKMQATGDSMLSIGRSRAKIYAQDPKTQTRFKDVAGIDEAIEEVRELVEFLKTPQKFMRLGGKLPKGILLVGPPGTGKTLLAKAVAGEAGVPFFSLSGSDFVEMFVGVGAARVRDLFHQAKEKAPCIIFIDELDAIGKSRGHNVALSGGFDERENTLNQLLVEIDGFDPGKGVVIIGATNRPEVLDQALLRPGRFDRQVLVDKPDMQGREAIFKVHTAGLKLGEDVNLKLLAAQTPGFAGADIANASNEAALLAARKDRDCVCMEDFEAAIERVVAGLEKRSKRINEQERRIVAYHESGHAVTGWFIPGAESVQKVSIVPRGIGALGYTLQLPLEDRYLMSAAELRGRIMGLLGGRAAEELIFGDISTGAANDLERVAQLARNMVTVYGMSKKLPNFSLVQQGSPGFLGQTAALEKRSERIEQTVDEEVLELIAQCYAETKKLIAQKREILDRMAAALLKQEVLSRADIEKLIEEQESSRRA